MSFRGIHIYFDRSDQSIMPPEACSAPFLYAVYINGLHKALSAGPSRSAPAVRLMTLSSWLGRRPSSRPCHVRCGDGLRPAEAVRVEPPKSVMWWCWVLAPKNSSRLHVSGWLGVGGLSWSTSTSKYLGAEVGTSSGAAGSMLRLHGNVQRALAALM